MSLGFGRSLPVRGDNNARGGGLAAPLAGQRSERPQKNKAHGGPVAPAQFSTEMALNDLESIGESIVMVENGSVR